MTCCQNLPVCYVPGTPIICGGVVQSTPSPPSLINPLLISNTSGIPTSGSMANLINGGLSVPLPGNAGFIVGQPTGYGGTYSFLNQVLGSFELSSPARVTGFSYWNGYGSDHSDGDGMGGLNFDLLDSSDAPLLLAAAVANVNNGARHDTIISPVDNVSKLLLHMGSKPFNGSSGAALREIALILAYTSTLTWTCNGLSVIGTIGAGGAGTLTEVTNPGGGFSVIRGRGITVAGGNLTQVGGPHTIAFEADGYNFIGNIVTNMPGNFSSLVVTNASPTVTITGNTTQTFAINWAIEPIAQPPRRKARLSGNALFDLATGAEVVNPIIVEC